LSRALSFREERALRLRAATANGKPRAAPFSIAAVATILRVMSE